MDIKEPTCEQCNANEKVFEDEFRAGYAIWYPQMGGYSGKAIALIEKTDANECFDVLVWHNGEFPFDGEGGDNPRRLHHCLAAQFVDFGEKISRLIEPTEPTLP